MAVGMQTAAVQRRRSCAVCLSVSASQIRKRERRARRHPRPRSNAANERRGDDQHITGGGGGGRFLFLPTFWLHILRDNSPSLARPLPSFPGPPSLASTYRRSHRLQTAAASRPLAPPLCVLPFFLVSLFPPGCSRGPIERIVKRGAKNPCPALLCSSPLCGDDSADDDSYDRGGDDNHGDGGRDGWMDARTREKEGEAEREEGTATFPWRHGNNLPPLSLCRRRRSRPSVS